MPTRQRRDSEEWRMCSALDNLKDFERYESEILPMLRRAVDERWPSTRIRKELASLSQALVIQQGLLGNINRSSQITAIKDVLDRHEGRARRRVRGTRERAELSREDLIKLAYKKLVDAGVIDED